MNAKPNANKGARCEFAPGFDLWMRGARYFTVVKVGRDWVHAKLDSGKRVRIAFDLFNTCKPIH